MRHNYEDFQSLRREAERCLEADDLNSAAAYVEAAVTLARKRHCGFYRSEPLEHVLIEIARRALAAKAEAARPARTQISRVLHVATVLNEVGGLTRMMRRWIAADEARHHSLALLRHPGEPPHSVREAVEARGGHIHMISATRGGSVEWARALRKLSLDFDLVVLHVSNEDPTPGIAFADERNRPPVVLVNHADHAFWLGLSVCDLVASSRVSGERLVLERRGIPAERHAILPIQIDPPVRRHSRAQARQRLGLPAGGPLLVSVARGVKYRTMGGVSFADMHVEALLARPDAGLLVVGPGEPADWQEAIAATGGRIMGRPETPDPSLAFEAADIYLDSYPFVSITSMLEAGGVGAPCVTLFPYPPDANVMSTDMPGLAPTIGFATSMADYNRILADWLADPEALRQRGEETASNVKRLHTAPNWLESLETLYAKALAVPPVTPLREQGAPAEEEFYGGYPDILLNGVFGEFDSVEAILKRSVRLMSLPERLRVWRRLARTKTFDGPWDAIRNLLPEWLPRLVAG
ncbi:MULTISPECIES: glycosyl transferase family 1 [unclassified Mesorhizobium]|uniref:glycosyl transferase family 1 n=1 Tax=unclassified Mesorhizobium TaxID=325217 RepID=UPI001CCD9544|nr:MULTISPECIES: glycosyl transferase family 1 [unclassified Mesorhizobium]MBZ9743535.1 glycosyl transferase family 1 [Mesorhizobium sp. CO1-1-4]MBZ9806209.1 glycosyl transferase family 1 [Mesorhizobium sp. ES1-6]